MKAANLRYQVGDTVRDIVELRHPRGKTPRPVEAPVRRGWPGRLSVLGVLWATTSQTSPPTGALRIQINPDVELTLSRTDRVLELEGLNEDGQSLIAGYEYSGKDREDVTGELVERAIDMGYLSGGETVSITVTSADADWQAPEGTGGPGGSGGAVRGDHRDPNRPRAGGGPANQVVIPVAPPSPTPSPTSDLTPEPVPEPTPAPSAPPVPSADPGITDYDDTDYGPNADGGHRYEDTDYGPYSDGVTDYEPPDDGPYVDGDTDYEDRDDGDDADDDDDDWDGDDDDDGDDDGERDDDD